MGSLWAMGDKEFWPVGDGTTDGGDSTPTCREQIVATSVTAIAAGTFPQPVLMSDGIRG